MTEISYQGKQDQVQKDSTKPSSPRLFFLLKTNQQEEMIKSQHSSKKRDVLIKMDLTLTNLFQKKDRWSRSETNYTYFNTSRFNFRWTLKLGS